MLSVLLAIRSVRQVRRLFGIRRRIEQYRQGLRGEQAVAAVLHSREVVLAGYFAFHDVPKDGVGNVDHLVLGPGGIFVVETKARSRRKPREGEGKHEVWYDGTRLKFPWGGFDDEAVAQTRRNADWVRKIAAELAPGVPVTPVVVMPGWFVKVSIPTTEVKVVSANGLAGLLVRARQPAGCVNDTKRFCEMVEERCRTVRF